MLGFEARSDGGEPTAHDGELEDVRWFTRAAVRTALTVGSNQLRLPPSISIARFLVERWVAHADSAAASLDKAAWRPPG